MSRGMWRSMMVVGGGTSVSRILGFVREVLMAVTFGTSLQKSAFDVAFKLPNLFRRLFGEGALSSAFVPVFTQSLTHDGRASASLLASRVASMLGVVLALIVAVGIGASLAAESLFTVGPKMQAVLPLLRIMLPYTLFICLAALMMGILNALGRFAIPSFSPMLLNLFWIVALLWVCPWLGEDPAVRIVGVAWAVVLAGVAQLAMQLPLLSRLGIRLRFTWRWRDERVRAVLLLMGPAALGLGVYQVNVMIDGVLALWVGSWAPAALTYAERLIYLPLGVIATAFGTVLLPVFSRQATQAGATLEMRRTLAQALGRIVIIMMPAAVGLVVLAEPIIDLAYVWKGGRFDQASAVYTVRALVFYAPGLVVFSIYKILVPVFYAMKDTKTPMRIGLVAIGFNLTLNLVCIVVWPAGYKHAGLAFATIFSSLANCVALAFILQGRLGNPGWGRLALVFVKSLGAVAVMGVAVGWIHRGLVALLLPLGHAKTAHSVALLIAIGCGCGLYALISAVLFREEALRILQALRERFRR